MRRAHRLALTVTLALTLALTGCAGGPMLGAMEDAAESPGAAPAPMAPAEPIGGEFDGGPGSGAPLPSYQAAQIERMIIRTVNSP